MYVERERNAVKVTPVYGTFLKQPPPTKAVPYDLSAGIKDTMQNVPYRFFSD